MWSFPWNRCILETAQAGIRVIGLFVFTLLVSVIGERLSISNTQIIIFLNLKTLQIWNKQLWNKHRHTLCLWQWFAWNKVWIRFIHFMLYVWLRFTLELILNLSAVLCNYKHFVNLNNLRSWSWSQISSQTPMQWPSGFIYWLHISHPNEFLNKENRTSRQQRKLLQRNTILQRTISEKDWTTSDQQEKNY